MIQITDKKLTTIATIFKTEPSRPFIGNIIKDGGIISVTNGVSMFYYSIKDSELYVNLEDGVYSATIADKKSGKVILEFIQPEKPHCEELTKSEVKCDLELCSNGVDSNAHRIIVAIWDKTNKEFLPQAELLLANIKVLKSYETVLLHSDGMFSVHNLTAGISFLQMPCSA